MVDGDSHSQSVRAPAIPRRFLAVNAIGACAVVAFGLVLYIGQKSGVGLFVVIWTLVVAPVAWVLGVRARHRLYDSTRREDCRTGQTLTPPLVTEVIGIPDGATQWIGGADLPGLYWRITTGSPWAVLELVESSLILRMRPEGLARLAWGIETFVVSPSEVEAVFPACGRLRVPAIGIRPLHGPPSYFLTAPWYARSRSADRRAILSAIEAAGFSVEWEERRFSRS
jgi:hypothetical protein